jgi:protein SCO1/2
MHISPWTKSLLLFAVTLTIVGTSFAFVLLHHEEGGNRIAFNLTDQDGDRVTQKNLAGKNLLVFFGFTSCRDVCPAQMSKLSNVMNALDKSGHGKRITPVFISVDPERDSVEKVAAYLQHFHSSFVGLTGTRPALQSAADRFKTLLDQVPKNPTSGYQLTTHPLCTWLIRTAELSISYPSRSPPKTSSSVSASISR